MRWGFLPVRGSLFRGTGRAVGDFVDPSVDGSEVQEAVSRRERCKDEDSFYLEAGGVVGDRVPGRVSKGFGLAVVAEALADVAGLADVDQGFVKPKAVQAASRVWPTVQL